jgi:uncharacterized membrane protein YdjX (TVP38/TMEM64 family)
MIRLDRKSLLQLLLIVLLLTIGTYLLYSLGLVDLLTDKKRLASFINDHRGTAAITFISLQVLQVLAAPIPGEMTGIVGGWIFGPFWGFVYSTIGLTIGSWLAFMIARLLGRHIVEVVVKPEVIERYDYVMKHKGKFLAFVMFLIPGFPKDILCYLLGLGHMGQRDFLLVSTSGRMFGTMLLTVGGSFFRNQRYGAFFTVAGIGLAAALIVMVYRGNIEGWLRRMRLAQHRRSRKERRKRKKGEGRGSASGAP